MRLSSLVNEKIVANHWGWGDYFYPILTGVWMQEEIRDLYALLLAYQNGVLK